MTDSTNEQLSASSGAKVRDLTSGQRRIPIETDGSAVYDLLLALWSAFDPEEDHEGFELGNEWFDALDAAIPDDLREDLELIGGAHGSGWLAVVGLVAESPYPHDIDSVLDWLSSLDPVELRMGLLSYKAMHLGEQDEELVERAARGELDAVEELVGTGVLKPSTAEHYRSLLQLPLGELRQRMVESLRRFRTEVYSPFESDFGDATSRAAAAQRALVRGADPERVIEEVTNGASIRIQPGVARIVLVPSVLLRPWAVIDQHRGTLVVAYPVADEFIDADPDAPPSWLVKLHKALGDERRLRILRRMSEGGVGLDDLATMLGLSKSTVHHHVGLLRGAGLVRIHIDHEAGAKYYTLRTSALPEAMRTLDDYLRSDGSHARAAQE